MPDIAQGARAKLILNPGEIVRVGTAGVTTVVRAHGDAPLSSTVTANTQTFGPYSAQTKLIVTANTRRTTITPLGATAAQTVAAAVSGVLGVGNVLTAVPPLGVAVTGYQWTRDGANISGATSAAYTQVLADELKTIGVNVSVVSSVFAGLVPGPVPIPPTITAAPVMNPSTIGQPASFQNGTSIGTPQPANAYEFVDEAGNSLGASYTPAVGGMKIGVRMNAINSAGQASVTSALVTVSAVVAPVANFTTSTTSGVIPLTVDFIDTSSGTPTEWEWEFFGAGLVQATTKNPSYTFREPGTYTVKMRPKNVAGQSEVVKTALITVTDKTYTARGAAVSRYVNGVEDVMYAPTAERLVEPGGAMIVDFTAIDPTLTRLTSDLTPNTRWAPQANGRRLTAVGGGSIKAVFPIPTAQQKVYDSSKALILKYWASDVVSNATYIKIDNGSFNSQSWQMNGTGFKRGWNIIVLGAPDNAVAREVYSSDQQASWISNAQGNPAGMNGLPIKNFTIECVGGSIETAGTELVLGSLETASKAKPVFTFTWDQIGQTFNGKNVFTEIVIPLFKKYGFVGDARLMTTVGQYNIPEAIAAGWGYCNGSETRLANKPANLRFFETKQEALDEYGNMNAKMTAAGLRVAEFGGAPGHNNGADVSMAIEALAELGAPRFIRGNGQRAIYHGVQGCPNRGQTFGVFTADANQTLTPVLKYIDGMIAHGGYGCIFAHDINWSDARTVLLEQWLAYMRQKVDAGLMDVMPLSGKSQRTMALAYEGFI